MFEKQIIYATNKKNFQPAPKIARLINEIYFLKPKVWLCTAWPKNKLTSVKGNKSCMFITSFNLIDM